MIDLDSFNLRTLQRETARAMFSFEATNNNIYKFNKAAYHDSQAWYKAVLKWYIEEYGGLPSEVGPGVNVKLVMDE